MDSRFGSTVFSLVISGIILSCSYSFHLLAQELDQETARILNECAGKQTLSLNGNITKESINRFKDHCSKTFKKKPHFPLALYSYNPSNVEGQPGEWSAELVTPLHHKWRVDYMSQWLKKNYVPADPSKSFQFFYFTTSPYINNWTVKKETLDEISGFLDSCPVLLSCNHPDLAWTHKAVLVPDNNIFDDRYQKNMDRYFRGRNLASMADLLEIKKNSRGRGGKGFVPFSERKSKVYFRGGLAGIKLPFTFEHMKDNPRQYLLTLLDKYPYLEVGVTNFGIPHADPEYKNYLIEKYGHLKCYYSDFFEHGENKYLLSCDGFGSAWSRVEYILATGSVLFLNGQCRQYFYDLMENGKTHVDINRDFSNLDDEFTKLENDPVLAESIGKQGREFVSKFLNRRAIDYYLKSVLDHIQNATVNN